MYDTGHEEEEYFLLIERDMKYKTTKDSLIESKEIASFVLPYLSGSVIAPLLSHLVMGKEHWFVYE